jgi:nucleotide-binding universal stress UspA family protein
MTGRIVVGWTNSPEAEAALDWSVNHALLTSRGVVLVHETEAASRSHPDGGVRSPQGRKLTAVTKAITRRFPDLDLTTVVETGELSAGLLRWAASADLLAVGASHVRHPRMLGALTDHLASAAESPVALIHRNWAATLHGSRTVVVGAKASPAGRIAMTFAAQEAVRMSAQLVAVVGADYRSAEGGAARQYLNRLITASPDLAVEVQWEAADDLTSALIRLSGSAQIVVVGTHHSADPWSIRLGPVTGAVLDAAACPVVTVARLRVPAAV